MAKVEFLHECLRHLNFLRLKLMVKQNIFTRQKKVVPTNGESEGFIFGMIHWVSFEIWKKWREKSHLELSIVTYVL